jgi:N-glycosylase/DNA lyase
MVESICNTFGRDLGRRHTFPTPREILDKQDEIGVCKLGFREQRFIELAQKMEDGDLDLDVISEMKYENCVKALMTIKGVGPKVADCVALFAFDHLDAFPVDVRIAKTMENIYGVTGGYAKVSSYGREKFGRFAGYAQEFLYHSGHIE